MEKIVYDIVVDSKEAVDSIKKINRELEETKENAEGSKEEVGAIGVAAGGTNGGFNIMSKAISRVGTALKATGIGLIVGIIAGLTDAFSRNKKVMDSVGVVMDTIQQVFSQVVTALTDTYDIITSTSDNFDALGKVINGLMTIALFPLKATFYQLLLASNALKLGYEKMFGDGESVKKAQDDLDRTKLNIIELGLEVAKAGKDIVNNAVEAVTELGGMAEAVSDNFSKVSIKAANNQAKANQKAEQAGVLAEAQAGRLVAQYERQAEQQRQLRDDTSASIEDRKKANEELGRILEEQEKQMLKQADAVIAAAQAELQKNGSIENQAALIAAVAAQEQVLADIEGKRSEQKVNAVALDKEAIDMALAKGEAEANLSIEKKKFNAEQITDEELKIKALKQILEEEKITEIDRLTAKKDSFREGTQAYVDAQNELNARKEEFRQQDITLEQQEKERKDTELQENIDNDSLTFEARREALSNQRQALLDDETLSEGERTKMLKANADANAKIAHEEFEAKLAALNAVGNAMSAFSDLAGKETAEGKALAIAAATISTFTGIASIWGNPSDIGPTPIQIATKVAGSLAVAASGFAAVKNIVKTKVPGPSPGPSGGNIPSMPQSPTFNVVGQSPASSDDVANGTQAQIDNADTNPTRAYVVSTDITSQQALDRTIESQGELG